MTSTRFAKSLALICLVILLPAWQTASAQEPEVDPNQDQNVAELIRLNNKVGVNPAHARQASGARAVQERTNQ